MLTKLSIQNYALIDDVNISFSNGFTTITGETGAGKSILLGGLGLILGNRADSSALMNPEKKCIIEGEFKIDDYKLHDFFINNDLDYESQTIIRRELLPSGKSRAFVNDTPVKLNLLNELHNRLIDIHSQHQTLELGDSKFQFQLIDVLADSYDLINEYKIKLTEYKNVFEELKKLELKIQEEQAQQDYTSFLFNELEQAKFTKGEQESLEKELEKVNNSELIQENLSVSNILLSNDEIGILSQLQSLKTKLAAISSFSDEYNELYSRVESVLIELQDIENEIETLAEQVIHNPLEQEKLNSRLQLLYDLQKKHHVSTVDELLEIQESLSQKVITLDNAEQIIKEKKEALEKIKKQVTDIAKNIYTKRVNIITDLENKLIAILKELGIPQAQLKIELNHTENFYTNGMDEIQLLFSANKGNGLGILKQVASGGELSRIMLAIKSIIALHSKLPTIIFDEIDTGVSGEIALKMGEIMKNMSQKMQVISITHLPQIAARGDKQMKVYKYTQENHTQTKIRLLSEKERITEIAEMLGGKNITETAQKHAQQLLQLKK